MLGLIKSIKSWFGLKADPKKLKHVTESGKKQNTGQTTSNKHKKRSKV